MSTWKHSHLMWLLSSGTLCVVVLLPTFIACDSFESSMEQQGTTPTTAAEETTNFHTPDNRLRVCGQRLTLEINAICNVGYYTPILHPTILYPQRNPPPQVRPRLNEVRNSQMRTNEVRVHRERERDHSNEIQIPTRVSRGVIEECCRKPCDRQTLLKYCANNESRRDGSETETMTTTASPTSHLVQKRTSAVVEGKNQVTTSSGKKNRSNLHKILDDNCLHCGNGGDNRKKENRKKDGSNNNKSISSGSGCRRSRRRKSRRPKLQGTDDGEVLLLPLLLQLLWEKLGKPNPGQGHKNMFLHHNADAPPLSPSSNTIRRQRPGTGRLTARDLYQDPPYSKNIHSRLKPSSDETVRDMQELTGMGSSSNSREHHHHNNNHSPGASSHIRTQASQVTDEPQPQIFAIPAGTNPDFFTI